MIQMDDVAVVGDQGAVITLTSEFEVADVAHLTDFTKVMLRARAYAREG